jgi:signal transduction histidine kinase/SAM-dependent methyltransferase
MATIIDHYERSDALRKVSEALDRIAPGGRPLTLDELAGFDHFHTAGAMATERMAELLAPAADDVVLDAGAGLGGPARYLTDRFGCRVIGVDLTPLFVEVGRLLNQRTGLDDRVELRVGDITELDLDDASVDHVWTQHVAMNIADREGLYREIRRVMRPGGRFALFDVIDGEGGELLLPVPWATEPEHSHLVTRDRLRELLRDAGFSIELDEDPAAEMIEATRQMLSAPPAELTTAMFIDDIETKGPATCRTWPSTAPRSHSSSPPPSERPRALPSRAVGRAVASQDDSGAGDGSLALSRQGLRFADAGTEASYREWHLDEAIPYTRIGMQTSIVGWIAATLIFGATVDGFLAQAGPAAFGLVVPLIVATILATYRPSMRRWVLPMTAVTNAVSGTVAAFALVEAADYSEASGVVVLIAYFGFAVFRLHPLPAFLAVSTYVVAHQVFLVRNWQADKLDTIPFVVGSTLPAVALSTGVVVCALIDRLGRESYRRHRIIEAQRAELADLNATLEARVDEQLVEIQQSRKRLVAAQDDERRRLERDLHDGAQQQLVALKLRLALASAAAGELSAELGDQLAELGREAGETVEALRHLAHGIYPPLLASSGLVPALRQQAGKLPLDVSIEPGDLARFDAEVEAAVYFCCLEALQNVAKHAGASHVAITLDHEAGRGRLRFTVRDDGAGFDPAALQRGHGLTNLSDRVEALGGHLTIESSPGEGTAVVGVVPVAVDAPLAES